jgi:hypothetical protein
MTALPGEVRIGIVGYTMQGKEQVGCAGCPGGCGPPTREAPAVPMLMPGGLTGLVTAG